MQIKFVVTSLTLVVAVSVGDSGTAASAGVIVIVLSFLSVFSFCSDLYQDVIPELKEKVKRTKTKI